MGEVVMATDSAPAQVLVVDDDPRSLKLMAIVLGRAGYGVVTVENAARALEVFRDLRPAAVLVDFLMPGMDGLEFCRRARAMVGAGEPVLALFTAMASGELRRQALQAGADEVFVKPFDRLELLSRLAQLLSRGGHPVPNTAGTDSGSR
jgi:DNA-binding response OmpR family regulator